MRPLKFLILCSLLAGIPACKPLAKKATQENPKIGGARIEPTDRLEKLALRLKQGAEKSAPEPSDPSQARACPEGAKLYGAAPPKGNNLYCAKATTLGKSKFGPYTKWDEKGVKRFEAYYIDDVLEGGATSYFPSGEKSEFTEFKSGTPNGLSERWNKRGHKVMEGHFFKGKKDGYFRYFSQDGLPTSEGPLRNEIRDGLWIFFDRQGKLNNKITYKAGEREGKAEEYFPSGTLAASGSYRANKPHGVWTYYSPEGRVAKRGRMELGKKVGDWEEYDKQGRLQGTKKLGGTERPVSKNAPILDTKNGFVQL